MSHEFTVAPVVDLARGRITRDGLTVDEGAEPAVRAVMLEKARESMEAGAAGLIFGRNVWEREHDESLRSREILAKYPS